MKIKLTKSDVQFLFSNFTYFEQFIKIMRELRCVIADDLKLELEDPE